MVRETRTFLFAIALPALVVAAGGARLLLYAWDRAWDEERQSLEWRARVIADAVEARAHDDEGHGDMGRPDDGPPGFMDGPEFGEPPPRRGERRHSGHDRGNGAEKKSRVASIADAVRTEKSTLVGDIAFEMLDEGGARLYATDDWPEKPGIAGQCPLGRPLGGGDVRVVRPDGGRSMRIRAVAVAAAGGSIVLLLVATLVAGGMFFMREVRRQREDARRKTDFVDNVSHELKTPLAGIRLNAELLADGRIPDEERRRGALAAILSESDRLSSMVDGLLDFSRLEKGTHRFTIEAFDLAEFARDASVRQSVAAMSSGRANMTVKGPCAVVEADRNAIRQIGANLITNAVKYSEGPIDIEVEGTEIRCMDRGPGIRRGDEERVFERFYRGDNSLTRHVNGSGIGLSIARALARGMGGDLTYRPREGGGSIFTLSLKAGGDIA